MAVHAAKTAIPMVLVVATKTAAMARGPLTYMVAVRFNTLAALA